MIILGDDGKVADVVALSFSTGEGYVDDFDVSRTSPKTDSDISRQRARLRHPG